MHARMRLMLLLGLLIGGGCSRGKSTDELISDLKTGKANDRIAAARLLPERTGEAAKIVPAMIERLKDKKDDVRLSAAVALGTFGEEAKAAIPELQVAERDSDARVRRAAGVALTRIDPTITPNKEPVKPGGKK